MKFASLKAKYFYAAPKMFMYLPKYFTTVIQKLNQGKIRFWAVIQNRGPFSFFLGKQKEKRKTVVKLVASPTRKKLTLLQLSRIIYCAQPKPILKYQTPGFGRTAHTLPLHYRGWWVFLKVSTGN